MFAYVRYLADGQKEIVPTKAIKNFDVNKFNVKSDINKKFKITWNNSLYDGTVVYIAETEAELEEKIEKNRIRIPPANLAKSADESSTSDVTEDCSSLPKTVVQNQITVRAIVQKKRKALQEKHINDSNRADLHKIKCSKKNSDNCEMLIQKQNLDEITVVENETANKSPSGINHNLNNEPGNDLTQQDNSHIYSKKNNNNCDMLIQKQNLDEITVVENETLNKSPSGINHILNNEPGNDLTDLRITSNIGTPKSSSTPKTRYKSAGTVIASKRLSEEQIKSNYEKKIKVLVEKNIAQQQEIRELNVKNQENQQQIKELTVLNMNLQRDVLNEFNELKERMKMNQEKDFIEDNLPIGFVRKNTNSIHLGNDCWLSTPVYDSIKVQSKSVPMFVKNMALAIFGSETLKKSSVTGKGSNRNKSQGRPKLDPAKILAIKAILRHWLVTEQHYDEPAVDYELSLVTTHISKKIAEYNRNRIKHITVKDKTEDDGNTDQELVSLDNLDDISGDMSSMNSANNTDEENCGETGSDYEYLQN